jgi:predicted dienelactone hydrolase
MGHAGTADLASLTVNNTATRGAFDAAAAPKILVEIGDAGHYAFSDLCFPSDDCNPPVTRTQDEAHALVLRWVLPFLKVYLRRRPELRTLPERGAAARHHRRAVRARDHLGPPPENPLTGSRLSDCLTIRQ